MDFGCSSGNTDGSNAEKSEMRNREDRQHWDAMRSADEAAASFGFDCLYRRYRRRLIRLAATLYTHQDAEDVVDSVFGQLWATRQTLEEIHTSVRAFLYVCVRHGVSNLRRNDRRAFQNRARFALLHPTPTTIGDVSESDESFDVRMARRVGVNLEWLLTRRELDAFTLQADGYSYIEIGEMLRITRKTVGTLLERARRRLSSIE